jgi:hypothetical protein
VLDQTGAAMKKKAVSESGGGLREKVRQKEWKDSRKE